MEKESYIHKSKMEAFLKDDFQLIIVYVSPHLKKNPKETSNAHF